MHNRNNRNPEIASEPPIHQYFNYILRYTILNGRNNFGEMENRENLRYALGVYAIIADQEILIKEFRLSMEDSREIYSNPEYPKVNSNVYDPDLKSMMRIQNLREEFYSRESKKILDEKYIPIAKKYMEIKVEEHLKTEMRIAKEFGMEYKPFYSQPEQTGI